MFPPQPPRSAESRRGMTLMEVMVALLVMTTAAQILLSALTASLGYRITKEERARAVEAASNVIEDMHSTAFYDVFASFNSDPADDPLGPGTAHGSRFDVEGLDPVPGQSSVGTVLLPERAGQLIESVTMEELGMPRDLDGDFLIDSQDHSGDYLILPVSVTIRWQSRKGERSYTMATMLADLCREEDYE
ncbi:MAG: type II secretion system protein [Planctomycetota bacterium]